jgi:hypothetical protein
MNPFHVAIVAGGILLPGVAAADDAGAPPPPASPDQACAVDVRKFCADVEPGQGRIVACLRNHEVQLSDSCKAARAAARARIEHKLQRTDPD